MDVGASRRPDGSELSAGEAVVETLPDSGAGGISAWEREAGVESGEAEAVAAASAEAAAGEMQQGGGAFGARGWD